MKINPLSNPNILKTYKTNQPMQTQKSAAVPKFDEVTFSKEGLSFAKTLAEVKGSMSEIPSVQRQQKLEDIAAKIRSGEYHIDSTDVAGKMISDILGRN